MSNPASHTPNPLQPIAIHAAESAGDLLGPPPVITGENPDEFVELLDRVRADAKPNGTIEEIWVRDFADLIWESRRLRRLKASLLQAAAHKGLEKVLKPLVTWEADSLAENWARRSPRAIAKVDKVLAAAGLTLDAVMAETLALRLDDIERIERMIASQEGRMEAALREIDRHRAVLAEDLRGAAAEIEEAEYEDVAPQAPARRARASGGPTAPTRGPAPGRRRRRARRVPPRTPCATASACPPSPIPSWHTRSRS